MNAHGGQLQLMTANGVVQMQTTLALRGEPFKVAAPSELLDIVQCLHGPITLEPKGMNLTVKANGTRLRLQCIGVDDCPPFPTIDAAKTIEIAAADLVRCLAFVEPATAEVTDLRAYLTGVLFAFTDKSLTCVGSNGHMMGVAGMSVSGEQPGMVIVPARVIVEVIRAIRNQGVIAVTIARGNGRIRFDVGSVQLTSSLLQGEYPDWSKVIRGASGEAATIEVPRQQFVEALARVSLIAGKEARVLLRLEPRKLTVEIVSGDQGAEETIAIAGEHTGQVALNRHQLAIAAQAMTSEKLNLKITSERAVVMVTGDSRREAYLLAPMTN
jgi:DNA polymerase III subunit beta